MRSRQRLRTSHGGENFWPSFTDMISTIAIILFFLILIIFIKNIIIANELTATSTQLSEREMALKLLDEELVLKNAEITEKEQKLLMLQDDAENLLAEVEQGQIALKLSEEQIVEQQKIIAMSNQELGNMRTQIQAVALIRVSILGRVAEAIETELKNSNVATDGSQVQVGENGNIILNNTLLFETGSSRIGEDGEALLAELANVFEKILDDQSLRDYIDAIQIEGHTDDIGNAVYNRELSTQRAISVVNYMFDVNKDLESEYGPYFLASGYSLYRPLVDADDPDISVADARAANRRIEISIILKDSHVQDIIDSYLNSITGIDN